ncbi:MAG: hypothetical protein RBS80_03050 [Thermoguttaceae bacterium]|jgi:hypothetical protein|nr:hypothetical protein [Thermoguttaceae bacterium]
MKNLLTSGVVIGIVLSLWPARGDADLGERPLALYVATEGNDAWSGRLAARNAEGSDGPFASLERARDEVRRLKVNGGLPAGGVLVEIAEDTYSLEKPLELTAEDSGTAEAPIVYWARPGEQVRLVGGKVLSQWAPVTAPDVLARMDETARGQVMQTDLHAQGVTDLGEMASAPRWASSSPGLEVFFNDEPMTLARWPNEGFAQIAEVHGETEKDIRGTKGCVEGVFDRLRDDSPAWALGFKPIPVEKIGLYEDAYRASWPVEHSVRP